MAVYTVHEPPRAGASPNPERFAFVRDGFYWWAFLLGPLWMLRHRLWFVLVGYVLVVGAVEIALLAVGASATEVAISSLLISLLVGLEAASVRRFTLWRAGWRTLGVASGANLEDAERRFFAAWTRKAPESRAATPPALAGGGPPIKSHRAPPPDVIGLFPEPGAGQ
jgi:hypothetical protein